MSRRLTEDEKPKKEAQREKMRTSGWRVAEKTQCVSSPPKTPEEIAQEQAQIYEQDALVAHMDFVFDAYARWKVMRGFITNLANNADIGIKMMNLCLI